jgi:hypothetical protein
MSVLDKNFLTPQNATSASHSSWSAERSALVADVLSGTGDLRQGVRQSVRLQIYGESMLPALWPGDVVEIANCLIEDVRPAEIVLARRDNRLFLHRMVSSGSASGFVLCGDSMPGPDPQFPPESFLGRLVSNANVDERQTGFFLRPGFGAKCSRLFGLLLCHCSIARRLVLKMHSRRKKSFLPELEGSDSAARLVSL